MSKGGRIFGWAGYPTSISRMIVICLAMFAQLAFVCASSSAEETCQELPTREETRTGLAEYLRAVYPSFKLEGIGLAYQIDCHTYDWFYRYSDGDGEEKRTRAARMIRLYNGTWWFIYRQGDHEDVRLFMVK